MSFKLILFDLDGTLVDSAPDIRRALNRTLDEMALPQVPADQVLSKVGDGAARLIERSLPPGTALDTPALVARFRHHYARHLYDDTQPYPGIVDLLEAASASATQAVLTNKPGDLARPLLAGLHLARYFADVIGDGDGFPRKPAPDAVHWLAARHRVTPAEILVVGDGLPDLLLARAAACAVAAVTWGYVARDLLEAQAPDWIVSQPAELVPLLGS
jgi:phosphoglycolate phosphatase